ncbi:MAG: hypothetical protein ABIH89_08085 [Elusimicrobiota bacterium]
MTTSALITFGALIAAELAIIFRGFFILSQYPLFHLPIIFFIFAIEILAGYTLYRKLAKTFSRDLLLELSLSLSALYMPFYAILAVHEKIALGLSFTSELPWYAITVYPAVILAPLAFAFTVFSRNLCAKGNNAGLFFTGSALFFFADIMYLWKFELIYTALIFSLLASIILFIFSVRTSGKFKYAALTICLGLLIYSQFPEKLSLKIKSFVREFKTAFVMSEITPYGEVYIHRKNGIYNFTVNHSSVLRYPDKRRTQEFVHSAMLQYPWAESILVIGGWHDTVNEILKYPNVKNVYWTNPVPSLIDIGTRIAPHNFIYPEKVRILKKSDPRCFIRKLSMGKIFDIVIISIPDPTNIFFNRYYTNEFFQEICSILSDNSMISLRLKTGEEDLSVNSRILSATVYNTLLRSFPNTLELYGQPPQILASFNRNFTTSYKALAEFLNALKDIPPYISPSLIKYKIGSIEEARKNLYMETAPLNTDSTPAAFRYSLREILFTFGPPANLILALTDNTSSLVLYVFLTLLSLFFLKIFSKKPVEEKIKIIIMLSGFIYTVLLFNTGISLHSASGRIYRFFSMIMLAVSLGIVFAVITMRKRKTHSLVSILRIFLLLSGFFLIILPALFEITLAPPLFASTFVFTFIGAYLFGSIKYLCASSYAVLTSGSNKFLRLYRRVFVGFSAACLATIIMVPILGIIDILPAIGILSLACVVLIST